MNTKEKNFVSAVVYLHNDSARAVEFCRTAAAELAAHFAQYELVVVDDACTDDTVAQLRDWGKEQAAPLTSFGSSLMTRTTVGRESSISLAFKIGFMLNRLLW